MKINYEHGTFTPEDVVKFLSYTGQFDVIMRDIIKFKEAKKRAAEIGYEVSDAELQQFADNFRKIHGLITAEDTYFFLKKSGLNEDDFEQFCEYSLLINGIKDRLWDKARIEEYFVNNRGEFDRARISVIVLKDENMADEVMLQVSEEGEDFHKLARKYSIDPATKYAGGYVGLISRRMLDQGTGAKVFNSSPGELLGPFNRGGSFHLILVEEIRKAELNEDVIEAIKEMLFEEWFSNIVKKGIEIS
jgi:parvulin-like peptidyl-prolyl isomerase